MKEQLKSLKYYVENVDELRKVLDDFLEKNPQSISSLANKLEIHWKTLNSFIKGSGITYSYNIAKIYNLLESNHQSLSK